MKRSRTLFTRLADFFGRKELQPAVLTPRRARAERPSNARGIEALEGRIAPAALLNSTTVQYNDLDGDLVTVTFSKALFDPALTTAQNKLDQIFTFTNGTDASPFDTSGPQQLQLLDLTKVSLDLNTLISDADGTSVVITSTKVGAGDDLTNVGAIKATNIALGRVAVDGDLGQIDAGRSKVPVGLKSLVVNSMYKLGATTQTAATTAVDALESRIVGELGLLRVKTDFFGYVHAVDGTSDSQAKITSVTIKGSVIGQSTVAATSDNTGLIESDRIIGTVRVLGVGDNAGVIGGGGSNSGTILADTSIGSVTIADSIVGGGGLNSGAVISKRNLAAITVGDDVLGGAGGGSGSIQARSLTTGLIGDLTGDDLIGGGGVASGAVTVERAITSVQIAGSITGGAGENSGGISSGGTTISALVRGDITGGGSFHSGYIESQGDIGTVRVLGTVTGGGADRSGTVMAAGSITRAVIGEKLIGGVGDNSGSIFTGLDPTSAGSLTTLLVRQGIEGGGGTSSGSVVAGTIGTAQVGTTAQEGNVVGGAGNFSGSIISQQAFTSVTVLGLLQGGVGDQSGSLQSHGTLNEVNIRGAVSGGGGDLSGSILANNRVGAGDVVVGRGDLGSVVIGGAVTDAAIRAEGQITSIEINNNVTGSTISAVGQSDPVLPTGDVAIARIIVRGNVASSEVLAGYNISGSAVNADASIGSVRVIGNWTASDLVAGVIDVGSNGFGTPDDTKIITGTDRSGFVSQLARVNISGAIAGTEAEGDHYGFVAQRILFFKNGASTLAFNLAAGDQFFELLPASTNDVTAREVAV